MLGTFVAVVAIAIAILWLAPRRRDFLDGERSPIHSIQADYAAGRISKAEARKRWKRAILQKFGW
jgi:hypothetical protein